MQLGIQNFASGGNNLMFMNDWNKYQEKLCKSKSMDIQANKIHYDRIINGLTDNRSIDILNQPSLKNVKKLGTREYIIKYIKENKNILSVPQMAQKLSIAIGVNYSVIYNTVVEEMKVKTKATLSVIDISVDGKTVTLEATEDGVKASESMSTISGIPVVIRDNETGSYGVAYWEGDNQTASRENPVGGFKNSGLTDSGDIRTNNVSQSSLPSTLPPQMRPITFQQGIPSTNPLETPVYATSSSTTREQLRRMDDPRLNIKTPQFLPEMDLGGPSNVAERKGLPAPKTFTERMAQKEAERITSDIVPKKPSRELKSLLQSITGLGSGGDADLSKYLMSISTPVPKKPNGGD